MTLVTRWVEERDFLDKTEWGCPFSAYFARSGAVHDIDIASERRHG
jgi:hypothetical protein